MENTGKTLRTARTAGFCFGVKRAVNILSERLDSGARVVTLGPVIHNPAVIRDFAERGGEREKVGFGVF